MTGRASLLLFSPVVFLLLGMVGSSPARAAVTGPLAGAASPPLPPVTRVASLPPSALIARRLAVYEERLTRWRELADLTSAPGLAERRGAEWPGCYSALEGLVRGYGRLVQDEQVSRPKMAGGDGNVSLDPWQLMGDDVAFLEGGCGQVFRQAADLLGGGAPKIALPAQATIVSPVQPEDGGQSPNLGEQEQLEKWNRAIALTDSGKYEEALGEFGGLLNTPYGAQAREKIGEAQTVVATQIRRQAAGIFVKARKTEDSGQKKKLLEESWTLLHKIVTSYPEVNIIDKVKQNLTQIEEQLEQLDPDLLRNLKDPAGK